MKIYNQYELATTPTQRDNKFGWHKTSDGHGVLAKRLLPSVLLTDDSITLDRIKY